MESIGKNSGSMFFQHIILTTLRMRRRNNYIQQKLTYILMATGFWQPKKVKVCEQEKRLAYKINCFLVSLTYMTSGLIILIEGINHLNIFADLISTRLTISWNVRISWKNGFFRK